MFMFCSVSFGKLSLVPFIFIQSFYTKKLMILCGVWYYFYNLKIVKNTHGGMLLSVKLHGKNLKTLFAVSNKG